MGFRTWPVAALGLSGLLALIVVFGMTSARKSAEIYDRLDHINARYRDVDTHLNQLRSDVQLAGIYVRDFLLDTVRARDPEYLQQIAAFSSSSLSALAELNALMPTDGDGRDYTASLHQSLDEYWTSFEPLFFWTPNDKRTQSAQFLRSEVLPRREEALAIAREIGGLNSASLDFQSREVTQQYDTYRDDLKWLLWQVLLLGSLVTLIAVNRLRVLERRSEGLRVTAETAADRTRALSQQLLATQEEERKNLSRELHDQVGQMLTGLRMELGRIERLRVPDNDRLAVAVRDSRALVDDIVRMVRDLALGLRPSMLDDFGLQPALEWHVRDFSRRYSITATASVEARIDALPDQHRTCIYRSVQEALTNCARHSGASRVDVRVTLTPDGATQGLLVSVKDNGVGMVAERRAQGLGLRGIEERVNELSGTLTIDTGFGTGTTLRLWLPVPERVATANPEESAHARLIG
jgi:signal transduction histidine kinase